jgi:RNA polymerase Rpb4
MRSLLACSVSSSDSGLHSRGVSLPYRLCRKAATRARCGHDNCRFPLTLTHSASVSGPGMPLRVHCKPPLHQVTARGRTRHLAGIATHPSVQRVLDYCQKFAPHTTQSAEERVRKTLKAKIPNEYYLGQVLNLRPETPDELKLLIPQLDVRFTLASWHARWLQRSSACMRHSTHTGVVSC